MLKRLAVTGSLIGLSLLLSGCSSVMYLDTARVVPQDQFGYNLTLVPLELASDSASHPIALHPVLIPAFTISYGIEPRTEIFARYFSASGGCLSSLWNYLSLGGVSAGGKYQYVCGPIDVSLFMQGAVPTGDLLGLLEGNYAIGGGPIVSCDEPGRFPFTVSAQALLAGNLGLTSAFWLYSCAQASAGVPILFGSSRQFRILPGISAYIPLANTRAQTEGQDFTPFTVQLGINFAYAPYFDMTEE